MDVDDTPSFKSALTTRNSSTTTTSSYETSIITMKQALQSDWSIQTAHHPLVNNLNSESDLYSFQIITKPMPSKSYTSKAHLYDPGLFSGNEFDFDASQEDEPAITRRQTAANVIESSEDENDEMYYIYN